eukprot:SAG31_NODE_366_length_16817_cov_17.317921_22_plen_40_part_01
MIWNTVVVGVPIFDQRGIHRPAILIFNIYYKYMIPKFVF